MVQSNCLNLTASRFKTLNANLIDAKVLISKNIDKNRDESKIVFATDFSESSFKTFLKLLEHLKQEKCSINFLYVSANGKSQLFNANFKAALQKFTKLCPVANIGIIWETVANNIAKGIEEVVDRFGGELVVVSCKHNHSLNLNKSYLNNFMFLEKTLLHT